MTLLILYPGIKLKVMSSGEALSTKLHLQENIVLIGGPDYNAITKFFLDCDITRFTYKSPFCDTQSTSNPNEIVIYDKTNKSEFCENDMNKDFGYFEKFVNPHNKNKQVIILGGCHTIGVTAAVKAFSVAECEHGAISNVVFENAKKVKKIVPRYSRSEYSILVQAQLVGQTINTPVVQLEDIFYKRQ